MVGTLRLTLGVLILFLLTVSSAEAFGGRFGFWRSSASASSSASSIAVPTYWSYAYYCVPSPMIVPVPDAARMPYARPTPAGPSQSSEPPLNRAPAKGASEFQAPIIVTTHSQGTSPVPLTIDRCRVGFWNLTGRELTLTVDGKAWTLPRDRATTLELARSFTWQADQQSQRAVNVPEGQSTFEVVIR